MHEPIISGYDLTVYNYCYREYLADHILFSYALMHYNRYMYLADQHNITSRYDLMHYKCYSVLLISIISYAVMI